jgi:hypothetical protein
VQKAVLVAAAANITNAPMPNLATTSGIARNSTRDELVHAVS